MLKPTRARPSLFHFALLLFALLAATPALATTPVNKKFVGGLAIDGYDPVAYFVDGMPVEGSKLWSDQWQGATWRFASAANRDRFAAAPAEVRATVRRLLCLGGCPRLHRRHRSQAWTIHDGKLYLNYDLEIRGKWMQDVPGWVAAGDKNWPRLLEDSIHAATYRRSSDRARSVSRRSCRAWIAAIRARRGSAIRGGSSREVGGRKPLTRRRAGRRARRQRTSAG